MRHKSLMEFGTRWRGLRRDPKGCGDRLFPQLEAVFFPAESASQRWQIAYCLADSNKLVRFLQAGIGGCETVCNISPKPKQDYTVSGLGDTMFLGPQDESRLAWIRRERKQLVTVPSCCIHKVAPDELEDFVSR